MKIQIQCFLFLIFFFWVKLAFSQSDTVSYKIVLLNGCTNTEMSIYHYFEILKRDESGSVDWFDWDDGVFRVPANEKLELVRYEDFDGSIYLSLSEDKIDTFTTSCFMENNNRFEPCCVIRYQETILKDTLFHINHIPLNGPYLEHFHSGELRIKGTFDKGRLIDTLFLFYRSGVVRTTFLLTKKNEYELTSFKTSGVPFKKVIKKRNMTYTLDEAMNISFKTKTTSRIYKLWDKNDKLISWSKRKQQGEYSSWDHKLRTVDYKRVNVSDEKMYKHTFKNYDEIGNLVKRIIFYDKNKIRVEDKPSFRELYGSMNNLSLYKEGRMYLELRFENNDQIRVIRYNSDGTKTEELVGKNNDLLTEYPELQRY